MTLLSAQIFQIDDTTRQNDDTDVPTACAVYNVYTSVQPLYNFCDFHRFHTLIAPTSYR